MSLQLQRTSVLKHVLEAVSTVLGQNWRLEVWAFLQNLKHLVLIVELHLEIRTTLAWTHHLNRFTPCVCCNCKLLYFSIFLHNKVKQPHQSKSRWDITSGCACFVTVCLPLSISSVYASRLHRFETVLALRYANASLCLAFIVACFPSLSSCSSAVCLASIGLRHMHLVLAVMCSIQCCHKSRNWPMDLGQWPRQDPTWLMMMRLQGMSSLRNAASKRLDSLMPKTVGIVAMINSVCSLSLNNSRTMTTLSCRDSSNYRDMFV